MDSKILIMGLDIEKMRSLRDGKGWTQQQAAERAKMSSRQAWQRIEDGRHTNVSIETLEAIAAALGVKAKDLLK